MGGHQLRFGENMPGRTPKSEQIGGPIKGIKSVGEVPQRIRCRVAS